MLLPPGINSKLGNREPEAKVNCYRDTGLLTAAEVALTIEESGWGIGEIEEREQRLIKWIRETWGQSEPEPAIHIPQLL